MELTEQLTGQGLQRYFGDIDNALYSWDMSQRFACAKEFALAIMRLDLFIRGGGEIWEPCPDLSAKTLASFSQAQGLASSFVGHVRSAVSYGSAFWRACGMLASLIFVEGHRFGRDRQSTVNALFDGLNPAWTIDGPVLEAIAATHSEAKVRTFAEMRLSELHAMSLGNPAAIARQARESDSVSGRLGAVNALFEQRLLEDLALAAGDENVRERALGKVIDAGVAHHLALYDPSVKVRRSAVREICDLDALVEIAGQSPYESVRNMAKDRLAVCV